MATVDLRKAVLEEVIALWDDAEALQQVLDYVLSLRGACTGLPHTRQERQDALMKAEADVMAGRVSAHEEVAERMRQRMESWK